MLDGVSMLDSLSPSRLGDMHSLLQATVARVPQGCAIDFFGRRWTWAEIGEAVDRVALGLQGEGVRKGDRVGLCLPNSPYGVIAYFAALKLGAIVVNYNPLYVERELEHQIRDSGTSVMFVIDLVPIHRKVAAVAERTGLRTIVLCRFADALPRSKAILFRILKRKDIVQGLPAAPAHVDFATLALTTGIRLPPSRRPRISRCCNIPAAPPACRRARC